jgi:hypothetical protein
MDAEAIKRVRSAATAVNFVGGMMLGCAGQTILTTEGWSVGSTSSIRSSAPLIEPVDRVVDDGDTVPPGASRPWGALGSRTRAAYVWLDTYFVSALT